MKRLTTTTICPRQPHPSPNAKRIVVIVTALRSLPLCAALLFGALSATPARAASGDLLGCPQIEASQVLSPAPSDGSPTPSTVGLMFGSGITRHDNTALILERGFPQIVDAPGRVAVFTRNGQRKWVRSGSIDAPRGQTSFGRRMAVFNDSALIETNTHAFFYRRIQGEWKRIQQLTPPAGYAFTESTIWNNWAFIGALSYPPGAPGAVYVYEITAAGRLRGVQTLRSYSGDPFDRFGERVVISNGRALVSARDDENGRGAAYVFQLNGSLFSKRQKLIAINGAANERFASSVAISGDWIAIGRPGAIYMYRRVNGTWLEQGSPMAGDACIAAFPSAMSLMISGNWLVATADTSVPSAPSYVPLIYKLEGTNFTLRAEAAPMFANFDIHLSNGILFAGHPFEPDCQYSGCAGSVRVYDLNNGVP